MGVVLAYIPPNPRPVVRLPWTYIVCIFSKTEYNDIWRVVNFRKVLNSNVVVVDSFIEKL